MEKYERVFNHFDANGDGKICAKELQQCMASIAPSNSKNDGAITLEEAERAVAVMDSDGDGLLSMDDFVKIVEDVGEEEMASDLKRAFEIYCELEGNGGCITPRSLRRTLSRLGEHATVERCRQMIACFDINGDGVLSFDEFKTMMSS